jgi:hypothetical protein
MTIRSTAIALLVVFSAAHAVVPGPASAAPSPCALVTAAEASAAMHAQALPGIARAGRGGASCRYYSANHQMNVFVKLIAGDELTGAAQLGGKSVPGVGDKAIWAGGTLFVQKGGNAASIGLYLNSASMQRMDPAIVSLGKLAASRM